jgi:hypothetical protein
MSPCPDCGELRGGRYRLGHTEVCWCCWMKRTGIEPLPSHHPSSDPEWVSFRRTIIDALWAVDPQLFVYINEDTIGGRCPICATGHVRVNFHGRAARADISCSLGCSEIDIAHGIAGRRAA